MAAGRSGFMDAVESAEHMLMCTIEVLRSYGISYLLIANRPETEAVQVPGRRGDLIREPSEFLRALASSPVPRIRDAVVSVLLLHPELVDSLLAAIDEAREQGNCEFADRLAIGLLATLYMQRMWYPELVLA